MGTEVQSKMHIPGYYSLRDVNQKNSSCSWSLSQPNNIFGHFDFLSTRPARNVNEGYHKEQLRQTILKHESIFRHQLCELHRLYNIQSEMMNEMRSKEFPRNVKPSTKGQRRFFDLELPADMYINDEDPSQATCGRDGNLFVRYGVYSGNNGDATLVQPNFMARKTNGLSNLNGPIRNAASFSSSPFLDAKFSQDTSKSHHVDPETERRRNGFSAFNLEPGQTGNSRSLFGANLHLEDLTPSSKSCQANQDKTESRVTKKIFGVEICERNQNTANSNSSTIFPEKLFRNDATPQNPDGGLPWLKALPLCDNNKKTPEKEKEDSSLQCVDQSEISIKTSSQSFVLDSSSATCAFDAAFSKQKASECSNKPHIDLNLSVVEEDAEPTTFSSLKTGLETTVVIDLEAPATDETESLNLQQDESQKLHEGLMRDAAEALFVISSLRGSLNQVDATCRESEGYFGDSLLWFAEIVSSLKGNIDNEVGSISISEDAVPLKNVIPDGMDYFEFMTLNLTETKVEECHYEPEVLESTRTEPRLPKRPRRGQPRRGRQRKDFQRDVLPNVASLMKNEVIEDLEMIEGLIRASGESWESGLALKHRTRSCVGKVRRRSGPNYLPPNDVTAVCGAQSHPSNCREVAIDDRSLLGWGKRTRRLPRQRCSINNASLPIK